MNDTNGEFSVFNKFGVVAVVIDVVGYLDDHTHDDRYYTETEVDAALADKADSADVYTKAETDQYRIADIEIMGRVGSSGTKASTGPFTSSRSAVGVYSVSLSDLQVLGLPFGEGPNVLASPDSGCNGGTAIAGWSSITGSGGILTSASIRIETYVGGVATDCGFHFSIRFQQSDDLADLLGDATGAPTRAPLGDSVRETERCTNDDDGVVCVDG